MKSPTRARVLVVVLVVTFLVTAAVVTLALLSAARSGHDVGFLLFAMLLVGAGAVSASLQRRSRTANPDSWAPRPNKQLDILVPTSERATTAPE